MSKVTDKELGLLADDLSHELCRGIHTMHLCKCGRAITRRGPCWPCLCEEVAKLAPPRMEKGK